MAISQCNPILSVIEDNWLMQEKNGLSRKDPSKTRRSFPPSFKIKSFGERSKSRNIFSRQHGNADTHLLCSSFFRVVSTLVMFLETEGWLSQARSCLFFCSDVAFKLCGIVISQDPFELGK